MSLVAGPELATALNAVGLYHGSARLVDHDPDAVEDDLNGNPYLAPYGGLYVTPDQRFADYYAEASRWRHEGLTGRLGEGQETIHRVLILTGAEIALDEDVFGSYDAAKHWQHGAAFWELYGAYGITRDMLAYAGLLQQFEAEVEAAIKGDDEEEDDLWDLAPDDFEDAVSGWTHQYVGPVFQTWLRHYHHAVKGGSPPPAPPEFRILNDRFIADPPLKPK